MKKFEKVEKIDYHLNFNFECNTESGSKESLSIALGIPQWFVIKSEGAFFFHALVFLHILDCAQLRADS